VIKHHNDYYTYAYLREDKTPYYIGKGRGSRIYSTHRTIKPPKNKSLILFLKKNLTESEAFKHEIYMIFVLGRKDLGTGILRNRTNGGDGASGAVQSAETKKKKSESKTGEKNPMFGMSGEKHPLFGVPHTDEWKQAHSERMSGENHPNYGKFGAAHNSSKALIAIKPNGTQLHFGGAAEAARELGINPGHLRSRYLKTGHVPTKGKFKGWQFIYENP